MKTKTKTRILIVDDEEPVRQLIGQILEGSDHACTLAANSAEARERLIEQDFELILCDIVMPGESGLELVRHVLNEYPETAAIIVSMMDDLNLVDSALRIGVYGYVVKPFKTAQILISVANALRRRELEIESRSFKEGLRRLVRKRTAALRESEEKFKTISASAYDAIVMMDTEGNVSYWNGAAERIFGYPRKEALGKELHRLIVPEKYRAPYEENFGEFQKTGRGSAVGKTLERDFRRRTSNRLDCLMAS
ncbi:MAG: response regulator, partial [Deltaproteobacteria bacterium]|nr:response regulator [Deltaproteobacteria bacterium]